MLISFLRRYGPFLLVLPFQFSASALGEGIGLGAVARSESEAPVASTDGPDGEGAGLGAAEDKTSRDDAVDQEAEAGGKEPSVDAPDPQAEVTGEISVRAGLPSGSLAPQSAAATVLEAEELASPPSSLAELAATAPAVSENGQGGLFQVISIRGVSRQRVLTLISGMRVTSERRAGVSGSFVDPMLLGSADVLRGPASSYYGSGALGGLLQVFPRQFDGWSVRGSYADQGDLSSQLVGWGDADSGWSLGLAHRRAGSAETPAGDERPSGFSQLSAVAQKSWHRGARSYSLMAIPAVAEDIGKPNTDFPDRVTTYPRERHLLLRFAIEDEAGWSFQAFAHPQDLETLTVEADGRAEVRNESFDVGASWRRSWSDLGGRDLDGRLGLEYFGRRGVDAAERRFASDGAAESFQSLDAGERDELGVFGSLGWAWGPVALEGGVRLTWQRQTNRGAESREDEALSGFVGAVLPLEGGFELVANAGTGLRFPSLSERFFTGTTGRGAVTGNPDLDAERSFNVDLGLRRYGDRSYVGAFVFRNQIDDYIERVEVAPRELTFVNLTSGTLTGLEVEGFFQFREHWKVSWGGHVLDAEDSDGEALADIPVHRIQLGLERSVGAWRWLGRWEHRFEKDDPGSGEKEISAADILGTTLEYQLGSGLTLGLNVANLLDEEYFPSADRRASLAAGRSVGLAFSWTGG